MMHSADDSIANIVEAFAAQRIVVLGDVMLDEYVYGNATRISPEAPVPVIDLQKRIFLAGGAANTASNIAALGGTPVLIGLVGRDAAGGTLTSILDAANIRIDRLVRSDERPTTTKARFVASGQQILRIDHESREPISQELEVRLVAALEEEIRRSTALVVSDYAKGVVSKRVIRSAIAIARQANIPTVVDPKRRSFQNYSGATVLTPNAHELELASGRPITSDDALDLACQDLLPSLDGAAIVVTRGALGMTLCAPGEPPLHIPAIAKAVFDVVGAGDTVASVLALGLGANVPLALCANLANLAAGIVVGKRGTATVSPPELTAAMQRPTIEPSLGSSRQPS